MPGFSLTNHTYLADATAAFAVLTACTNEAAVVRELHTTPDMRHRTNNPATSWQSPILMHALNEQM